MDEADETPQWLREPTRDEIKEVLSKVASVPRTGLAMVDVEALEEAEELLRAMQYSDDQATAHQKA